jgi:hypothetical protein
MINLNIFNFEGYQVAKLKEIESQLTASDYKEFLTFLTGQTMTIDPNGDTLIFYSDISSFLTGLKRAFIIY